jgi:hypothetical protein
MQEVGFTMNKKASLLYNNTHIFYVRVVLSNFHIFCDPELSLLKVKQWD